MRVALDVGEGVVLAVHGHPLPGADPGGDPHQEAEHLRDRALERDGFVSEPAMQEDRRRHEGDERHAETDRQTQGDDPQHRSQFSTPTYRSVGAGPEMAYTVDHGGNRGRTDLDPRSDHQRGPALLRRSRLRRHVAQRHRRGGRHPPSEPAAPLSVERGAVPRGLRAAAQRLVRAPGRGGRRARARLGEGANWSSAPASTSSPTTTSTSG